MRSPTALLFTALSCLSVAHGAVEYYGKFLGPLSSYYHGVTGDVYAVDARTLHIRNFNYDGEGPVAYFYVGNTKTVNGNGHRLLNEKGLPHALKRYHNKHITLTLPEGKTLSNIKWFAVWCDEAAVNFGDVKIPKGLDFPKPQKLAALSGVHAVSSEPIVVVDAQTLLIPSFSYDGEAPDAKFWSGRGARPSPQGVRIPDENGKEVPLRRYNKKTIVLTLPGDLTVFEIGHFGIWCEAFTVDFGHIQIPAALNVPPSLKMLGVAPQSKLNCEVLHEDLAFEVRWAVAGDSVVVQLVAKLENGEYMSFGPSGNDRKNQMIGADIVVAWVDHDTLNGYAVDYFLDDKSQCSGNRGSCPDVRIAESLYNENTSSVRLLNAALVNGYSIVTYQRPLRAHDALDKPIYTNSSQAVVWGVGPLNQKQEVSFHSVWSKQNILIDFGRTPQWNCPIPEQDAALGASNQQPQEESVPHPQAVHNKEQVVAEQYHSPPPPAPVAKHSDAWEIPPIQCNEPDDGVFYAQMGPTGGKRGYPAITGHVGWGISYYINGLLIPEINVVRGKTYTFVVEGGLDPSIPAKYHPFYITDSAVGGYEHKSPEEQKKERIFAGVEQTRSGNLVPTGVGRLCNWTPDPEQPDADEFVSFGAYQRTLTLICDHGEPGVIQWTPDEDTPDTVYYQCFVHRYLGWKINVLDRCDLASQGSAHVETRVKYEPEVDELESHSSIKVPTRVKPEGPNFLPLVSSGGLKNSDLMAEYKKNFAQIPANFKDQQTGKQSLEEVRYGVAPNHRYPANTMTVYGKDVQSTTEDNREMIPVSEDTSQDISTERTNPMLNDAKHPQNHNITEQRPTQGTWNNHGRNPIRQGGPMMVRRPAVPTMTIIRPHHRRPVPHHHVVVVQKPLMHRPMSLMSAPSSYRPVFVKKPIYRVPPMTMNRPVMMMPPSHHQSEMIMAPPKQSVVPPPQVTKTVSVSYSSSKNKNKPQAPIQIKSEASETKKYILPHHKPYKQDQVVSTFKSPVSPTNGGFNPGTLVIEGGFKPIIQNTQEAQDRISEVEEMDDTEGTIDLSQVSDFSKDINTETKATEYFEPMFIPSPPDSMQKHHKKPTGLEFDVLQKKKAYISHKPVRQNMIVIRRRPASPSFRSTQDESIDETPMAAERMDTYYLPPSGPVYGLTQNEPVANFRSGAPTLLTYDGKQVSLNNVVPPPSDPSVYHKRRSSTAELIRSTPQFAPFRGEIPPPIPDNIRPENIPQLKFKSDERPAHALKLQLNPEPQIPSVRTQLSLVRNVEENKEESDGLLPEASNLDEYIYQVDSENKTAEGNDNNDKVIIVLAETPNEDSVSNSETEHEVSKGDEIQNSHVIKRDKRTAHNVPGYEEDQSEHMQHDHHDHLHDHHDHHQHVVMKQNGTSPTNNALRLAMNPTVVIISLLSVVRVMF